MNRDQRKILLVIVVLTALCAVWDGFDKIPSSVPSQYTWYGITVGTSL